MKSVQIYKKILLSRVDIFRKMLLFRPSDIKMAKNMMDGPVLWCFAAVFGAVRHKIAQKVVGRSVIALWGRCVFLRGMPGVGISPLSPLARHSRSGSLRHSRSALSVIPGSTGNLPTPK